MLRITTHEDEQIMAIKLEGRVAGPWVAELIRAWTETAPKLIARKLSLDLRNITYVDAQGMRALREIYGQTGANLVTSTPWTQYLAEEVTRTSANPLQEGV
jgi:anti-anti-sigma regulatory factor